MDANILLVDDDRLLREVIGEYLSSSGYKVDLAEDASIALAKFNPGKYHLALIDMVMPGMNGLDLMKEIMQRDPNIFCLIMTGYPTIDSTYKAGGKEPQTHYQTLSGSSSCSIIKNTPELRWQA